MIQFETFERDGYGGLDGRATNESHIDKRDIGWFLSSLRDGG